ncbi:molybdopterin-guanine dinucleotide biosynthesis protein B [Thermodesulfobacteriota bacterium]
MILGKTVPPLVSIIGYSGVGKTTLLEKLIAELTLRGFRVGTIKHDVHGFEMDRPGKDSWRLKKAGASATIITSPFQIGMVKDVDHDHRPEELLSLLSDMDLVLVEGFKRGDQPKIEIYRPEVGKGPACKGDKRLLALVSDAALDWGIPRFSTDDIKGLTDFVIKYLKLPQTVSSLRNETAL